MSRFQEFTLAEAMEIAKRNDPGADVPSVSRVMIAEIESLAARLQAAEANITRRDDDVVVPLALWEEMDRAGLEWKAKAEAAEARCAELEGELAAEKEVKAWWQKEAEEDLETAQAAEAEREGLRRDAERWVFVRDNWHNLCTATGCNEVGDYIVTEIFVGVGEHIPFKDGSVQAAIDAALHGQATHKCAACNGSGYDSEHFLCQDCGKPE